MNAPTLLLIDDEIDVAAFIGRVARLSGFSVYATCQAVEFKRLAGEITADVIVMDLRMPGADGVELLRFLADQKSTASILIMSGVDRRVLDTAGRLGRERGLRIAGTIAKPVRAAELRAQLLRAAEAA